MPALPLLVLLVILLIAGYVVYRSMLEERRRDHGVDPAPGAPARSPAPQAGPLGSPVGDTDPADGRPPAAAPGDEAGPAEEEAPSEPVRPAPPAPTPSRSRARPRRRRPPAYDPRLAEHIGKLRDAVDASLISTDEAVASLVRSSNGALDDDSARNILAQAGPGPSPSAEP